MILRDQDCWTPVYAGPKLRTILPLLSEANVFAVLPMGLWLCTQLSQDCASNETSEFR